MQTANSAACTLRISVAAQTLEVRDAISGAVRRIYPISTSQFGLGTEPGSLRTPLGRFRIGEKIGHDAPAGTVFRGRQPDPALAPAEALVSTVDDLILSRILWLEGIEPHNANTRERYIYIHGTNHEARIGEPASHGCIRMRNADVIELFASVPVGTELQIDAA
ncbi:MAG: L,D-transpeptidase [Verrucomicrobia bacterium]|nr:L,D-transpeptidase [Verrucomicrobiota bacterium]